MERKISSLKFGIESSARPITQARSRCSTCGDEYETPVLAMIYSGFLLEEYYACPKCLSKMGTVELKKTVEIDKAGEEEDKTLEMEVENKMEENIACAYNLGYLKRRPKNMPVPEECLTCSKMIDCMSL